MPPAHAQDTNSSGGVVSEHHHHQHAGQYPPRRPHRRPSPAPALNGVRPVEEERAAAAWGPLVAVLAVVVAAGFALALATCLLLDNADDGETTGGGVRCVGRTTAARLRSSDRSDRDPPTVTPMLSVVSAGAAAGMGGMDRLRGGRAARELAVTRDRQVRLHAVHTDLAINLPPSISLPDGEEHHHSYAAASRLQLRDSEQESEIYQKCIRPPPNRTVLESESPPPYRSSSASVLASSSSSSGGSDWSSGTAPLVVRCHSMSSTSSSMMSKTGSTISTHHHHHHHHHHNAAQQQQQQGGPKTDFLQRTVKIFTGKKTPTPQSTVTTTTTTPVVIVPATASGRQRRDGGASRHPPPV